MNIVPIERCDDATTWTSTLFQSNGVRCNDLKISIIASIKNDLKSRFENIYRTVWEYPMFVYFSHPMRTESSNTPCEQKVQTPHANRKFKMLQRLTRPCDVSNFNKALLQLAPPPSTHWFASPLAPPPAPPQAPPPSTKTATINQDHHSENGRWKDLRH